MALAPTNKPRGLGTSSGVEIADIAAKIMDTDSPLMRRADAKGRAYANSRGLMNSSMGAEAAQAATLDFVTPMAQTERSERGATQRTGMEIAFKTKEGELNRAHEFKINEQQFGFDKALQLDQQKWQSGENKLDRDWDLTLQSNQQGWQGEQNALDRALTASEGEKDRTFTSSEAEKDRTFTSTEAEKDRSFTGLENQKDRDNSMALAESEQAFRLNLSDKEYEQALGLTKQEFENALKLTDVEFQNALGMSKEEFRQQLDILGREQGFTSTESQKQREFEQQLQSQGFDFTGIQNELDRKNSVDLARMEQQFRTMLSEQEYQQALGLSKEEFKQAVSLTDIEFENALNMTKTEFANALDILGREQGFTQSMAEQEREFAAGQAEAEFDRQKYLTELELTSREDLALLDADTRKDLMQMEDDLRTKIAQMELDDSSMKQVGDAMVNFHAQYQDAFRSILNNPDLDADTRNSLMRSMGDMLDNQLDGIATLYGVDVGWNADGTFDPVTGNTDPAEEETASTSNNSSGSTPSGSAPSFDIQQARWASNGRSNETFSQFQQRMGWA